MKKFLSMVLALVMAFSLCCMAYATEDNNVTVEIKQIAVDASYQYVRLLDATGMAGENGATDSYNYKLPTDSKAREFLLNVFLTVSENTDLWGGSVWSCANGTLQDAVAKFQDADGDVINPSAISIVNQRIYDMISSTYGSNGTPYESLEDELLATLTSKTKASELAEAIYNAIDFTAIPDGLSSTFEVEGGTGTKNVGTIPMGYYIFVQTGGARSEGDYAGSTSLYMLNTASALSDGKVLHINPKVSAPEITKQVRGETWVNGELDTTGEWADWVVSGGNRDVRFQLTGTLPQTYEAYYTYKYMFHDTMQNMNIKMVDGKPVYTVMVDPDGKGDQAAVDVTASFVYAASVEGCDCNVHFGVNDLKTELKDIDGNLVNLTKDAEFVLTYTATVDGANAVVGAPGNKNSVYLEYSSDPYYKGEGEEPTEETPEKFALVFTFETVVNKKDGGSADNRPLQGASFKLERLIGEKSEGEGMFDGTITGEWVNIDSFQGQYREDGKWNLEVSEFTYAATTKGIYRLSEERVPDGYNGVSDIYFAIDYTAAEVEGGAPIVTFISLKVDEEKSNRDDVWAFMEVAEAEVIENVGKFAVNTTNDTGAIDVVNMPGSLLPTTGGAGTTALYIGGAAALAIAIGALFVMNKKKEKTAE